MNAVEQAHQDCELAFRWYRLASDDAQRHTRLARQASVAGSLELEHDHLRQREAALEARTHALRQYDRALQTLHGALVDASRS